MSIVVENGRVRYMGSGIDLNPTNENLELYIQGEYVCGWNGLNVKREDILSVALVQAMNHGKKLRSKEIRELI